ncbi:uncharacterized protein LOC120695549 [Panicum virgatum]|uniref:uncharacterized protein LOC120695549 n=1 Tax=Panicum virgatum TaxID=38727 RepID=UPI0019D59ACE|nr:uncharacterized protein LOC120695549 [Panicum virgatum]
MPNPNTGKLPGQAEPPVKEHINAITTKGGRSTQDPPHPNDAGKQQEKTPGGSEAQKESGEQVPPREETPRLSPHDFYDTMVHPFPQRQRRTTEDEQFGKFVEVPTYSKYLKDILNNKKPLPSSDVLADQSVRYPEGVAENISVRVWDFLIPEDFVVLDMALDMNTPLILGRPFLSTAKIVQPRRRDNARPYGIPTDRKTQHHRNVL